MFNVLYRNHDRESEEAEKFLRKNKIPYESVERPVELPELLSKDGDYVGLESIKGYVNLLVSERKI